MHRESEAGDRDVAHSGNKPIDFVSRIIQELERRRPPNRCNPPFKGRADTGPGTALRRSRPCLISFNFLTGPLFSKDYFHTGEA
jgi:hypothetical protein